MTGKRGMPQKNHLACYRQSRPSKGPRPLLSASYVEYVCAGFIRFFVLISFVLLLSIRN
jgi:hypothetical protein